MNAIHKTEFMNDLNVCRRALTDLIEPLKGKPRGFYLKSYKNAYTIMKDILGNLIGWDVSLRGREVLKELLGEHIAFLQQEVKHLTTVVKNERRAPLSVLLSFTYITYTPEQAGEVLQHFKVVKLGIFKLISPASVLSNLGLKPRQKKMIFNTSKSATNKDIAKVVQKFYNTIGGQQYGIVYNLTHTASKTVTAYNALTVPLKASNSSKLNLFTPAGELIVDNIDEGNSTCVIDFIHTNYVQKYARKYGGNGKFPNMSKEEIEESITHIWITKNEENPDPLLEWCEPPNYHNYSAREHGVCILQLQEWCRDYKITLQCLDTEFNVFHTQLAKNSSRESMMVVIDDGHIYNVKDKVLRKSVQNQGRGAVHNAILQQVGEKAETIDYNNENTVALPTINLEALQGIEQKYIFITGEDDLEDLYVELWAQENAKYAYRSNCNLMTQITLKDKTVFYNQDYTAVLDICKNLAIPFQNQSLISLGMNLYNQVNTDYPLSNFYSHFNTETARFFQSARRDNWVTSYKNGKDYDIKKVSSIDICKCYSSILSDDTHQFMTFSSKNEVRTYRGQPIITNAFYYVETNQTILFQGSGVYIGEVVKLGLEDGLIKKDDIKQYVKSTKIVGGQFKSFVEYVFKNCGDNAKYIINTFIGAFLGKTLKSTGKIKYTDNLNTASVAFFMTGAEKAVEVFIKGTNADGTKTLYGIDNTKREVLQDDLYTLHAEIIQRTYINVYKLIKLNNINIAEDLIAVKTDNIIFRGEVVCPLGTNIGDYRKETITRGSLSKIQPNTQGKLEFSFSKVFNRITKKFKEIVIDDEYNIEEIVQKIGDKSVLLMGRAGTGKSYVLRGIYDKMIDDKKNVVCSAFTHKAKKHLKNGMTLHKMFGFDINGKRSHKTNFGKVDAVIIDEVSMMPLMFYDALISLKRSHPHIQLIVCGDFNQLQPVNEENINFLNLRVLYDLCPNKLTLKVNKRVQDKGQEFFEVMEKALNGEEFKLPTTAEPMDLNICYTNKTRKIVNRKLMIKERGDVYKTLSREPMGADYKHQKLKSFGNSQTIYLYEGLPLLCKGGKNVGELSNGDLLRVEAYNDNEVVMKRTADDTIHTVKLNDMFIFSFYPAYCLTVHSAQGDTIDKPYAIYDMERFPSVNMTYTALSRSTKLEHIFIGCI